MIMPKGSKVCGLYILDGYNFIRRASLVSENFYDKNKLWDLRSRHINERRTKKGLKVVLYEFNEFCMK